MEMQNLLSETLAKLAENHKRIEDVAYCECDGYFFGWQTFAQIADKEYDDCYGFVEVNLSLKIHGSGWWLERHEYDGAECWVFRNLPVKPIHKTDKPNIFKKGWQ